MIFLCVSWWCTACRNNKELVKQLNNPPPGSKDLHFPTRFARNAWAQFKSCLETAFVLLEKPFIQFIAYHAHSYSFFTFSCTFLGPWTEIVSSLLIIYLPKKKELLSVKLHKGLSTFFFLNIYCRPCFFWRSTEHFWSKFIF